MFLLFHRAPKKLFLTITPTTTPTTPTRCPSKNCRNSSAYRPSPQICTTNSSALLATRLNRPKSAHARSVRLTAKQQNSPWLPLSQPSVNLLWMKPHRPILAMYPPMPLLTTRRLVPQRHPNSQNPQSPATPMSRPVTTPWSYCQLLPWNQGKPRSLPSSQTCT